MNHSKSVKTRMTGNQAGSGVPWNLFVWVVSAVLLLQAFNVVQGTLSTYSYVKQFSPSINQWWIIFEFRGLVWMLTVPLLAVIIVDRRTNFWGKTARHLGLFLAVVAFLGSVVHPLEHRQREERDKLDGRSPFTFETTPEGNAMYYYQCNPFVMYWILELGESFIPYAMMTGGGYAVFYFSLESQRKQEAEQLQRSLVQLQHETLCNRLQPHFLFNTLNTISSLMAHSPNTARECISRLGTLLRHSIEALPELEVGLEDELEILECYLKIQKLRFGDKLHFEIDFEDSVAEAMVPAFLLQPFVENSFQHGFRGDIDVGYVGVFARQVDGFCELEVVDNGATEALDQQWEEHHGIGLTRQRLQLQYGNRAKLHFEPNQPRGLKVRILVPLVETA